MKRLIAATTLSIAIGQAYACASCGCSLNTDYGTQGMSNAGGWTLDMRYDYVNQNQLRSGTGKISNAAAASTIKPNGDPAEVEGYTKNKYLTASIDYNDGEKWGITAHLPYISRDHMTYGTTLAPINPGNDNYQSKNSGLGDIKLIGRYFGWADEKDWGLQFGLKLPTGRFDGVDSSGTNPVDTGLQLGTKTTDLILGAYKFGQLSDIDNWGYFASVQYQRALNSSNIPDSLVNLNPNNAGTYRPGNSVNLNFGLNFHGYDKWTPTLQFNYIDKKVDGGSAADTYATGGKLLYVTPGAIVSMTEQTKLLLNLQLPLYQNVNGIQLTPKYVASVGVRIGF